VALPELRWYASDGVTPAGSLSINPVGPGQTYSTVHGAPEDFILKNEGGIAIDVTVAIRQVASSPGWEYVRIAVGDVTPGPYVAHTDPPLACGVMDPSGTVRIWVDVIVPPTATRGFGEGVNLRAVGV
jgi:hypothetical protein